MIRRLEMNGSRPHQATLYVLASIALGVAFSLVGFFAKADRDSIKEMATITAATSARHETEIALLKQSLARLEADTAELKMGQEKILASLERLPVRAARGNQ